jgi:hypothetical protein
MVDAIRGLAWIGALVLAACGSNASPGSLPVLVVRPVAQGFSPASRLQT